MKTEIDFPSADETHVRATAWALGQLTPEETTAFEAEMAANPGLAAYAEEMRQFTHLLATEFPTDESGQLPEASCDRIIVALSATGCGKPRSFLSRHWQTGALLATAACAVLSLNPHWLKSESEPASILATPPGGNQVLLSTTADLSLLPPPSIPEPVPRQIVTRNPQSGVTNSYHDSYRFFKRPELRLVGMAGPKSDQSFGNWRSSDYAWHQSNTAANDHSRDSTLRESGTESYKQLPKNVFQEVTQAPLSTFSIDVDTASYANVRRFLNEGQRPPAEAVRLEELVNYFPYEDVPPQDGKPFAVRVDLTNAPWNPAHRLARVSLKGKEIATAQRPASNLVFLVDVSGSMAEPNKLPLVQQSLRLLAERLTENDRVSLVTYAGSTAVVLPSTNGQEKTRILAAIDALSSGGSTNGAGGLSLAYQQAAEHFIKDGVNRVILATDGDFNVGISSHEALLALIQEKAKTGVFLSVLGYGRGNLKDDTMELLADKGNGNYGYIDSLSEARKTLVEQMSGTLVTIAKDVKIQIEFNPAAVKSYRLLGYENRLLAKEDFNDDKKDAGEIGAGHNVTALYEIVPAGAPDAAPVPVVDGLKYQQVPAVTVPKPEPTPAALNGELMNVKLRWKLPAGDTSELLEVPVKDSIIPLDQTGQETRWAAAVAGFAQLLRGEAPPTLTWEMVRQLARSAKGSDPLGYRGEFLQLIDKAESLSR
jgi:secreted protein with Ig-like and vWFA domain